MKHGSGIKDRDDKSSGIEILMAEGFAKIRVVVKRRWKVPKRYLDLETKV